MNMTSEMLKKKQTGIPSKKCVSSMNQLNIEEVGASQPEPSPTFATNIDDEDSKSEEITVRQVDNSERPVRLFVGQIPESMVETHVNQLFKSRGINLLDVAIIRDKHTGRHRHCAFITVTNREAADNAIDEFHNKRYLESMANPMQVREANQPKSKAAYAAMRAYSQMLGTAMPVFAQSSTESHNKATQSKHSCSYPMSMPPVVPFNPFLTPGYIHQVTTPYIYSYFPVPNNYNQLSNNAGINSSMNYLQINQGHAGTTSEPLENSRSHNVDTKLPTQAVAVNGVPTCLDQSQGCRYVSASFSNTEEQAPNAVATAGSYYYPSNRANNMSHIYFASLMQNWNTLPYTNTYVEGPSGSNLFVNHLPDDFGDENLYQLFAPFGNILSYKVFVDKNTLRSKGFGFVSFSNPCEANQAIKEIDGFEILADHKIIVELKRPRKHHHTDTY